MGPGLFEEDIQALKSFMERVSSDHRVSALHVSLYVAIFVLSSGDGLLQVRKKDLMKASRINGKTAYYKCLKELAEYGYIEYWPEHWTGGSMVRLVNKFGESEK